MEAVKNIKPPTREELENMKEERLKELATSKEAAKAEAKKMAEGGKALLKEIMEDKPPSCWPLEDVSKRMNRYVDLLISAVPEGKLPPNVQEKLKPGLIMTIQICTVLSGWIAYILRWVVRIWNLLPLNLTMMFFGVALCYFGGTFTISIAAAEAFRTMGGEKAMADIQSVIDQVRPILEANTADDELDEDGDGEADVDALTPPQLLQRKAFLLISTVKEPQKIQAAVGSVYAALLAVLATLKLEFAQTTAMAMGMADMVKKPLFKFVVPLLKKVLPPPTHQWIEPTIDSVLRLSAISIAWYIQSIISAFYSALRGGKLFAQGLFNILEDYAKVGLILCPGVIGPDFDPDESILDDVIGWIIAANGFMFQINSGFALPFPFNIIFAPLTFLEWYLRLKVSGALDSGGGTTRRLDAAEAYEYGYSCDECCLAAGWTNATWGQGFGAR